MARDVKIKVNGEEKEFLGVSEVHIPAVTTDPVGGSVGKYFEESEHVVYEGTGRPIQLYSLYEAMDAVSDEENAGRIYQWMSEPNEYFTSRYGLYILLKKEGE